MAKVVSTDNFDGDYPDEAFVTVGSVSSDFAAIIAEEYNRKYNGDHASRYFKVVADDYNLVGGFEP